MNRTEFETLRDLPGKKIKVDIRFSQRRATQPNIVAEDIRIENDVGTDLRMSVNHNPEVGSTTINVHIPGVGPICRLDVDGAKHRPAGRCHKHSLQGERCPDRGLPDKVIPRPELSRRSVREIFATFCSEASIEHEGDLYPPDEPAATIASQKGAESPAAGHSETAGTEPAGEE